MGGADSHDSREDSFSEVSNVIPSATSTSRSLNSANESIGDVTEVVSLVGNGMGWMGGWVRRGGENECNGW